jgi:hypothetical protein
MDANDDVISAMEKIEGGTPPRSIVFALECRLYAECPWREALMVLILLIGIPLAALIIWAAVFDLKRRHSALTAHDISAAALRARGDADRRSL